MKLELRRICIKDIRFGDETAVKDGVLYVSKEGLSSHLKKIEGVAAVTLDVARPGEKVRIIPVKDVIEPRVKVGGAGIGFASMSAKPAQLGDGAVNVLYGAAVVTIGDLVGFQEGVIDMWGEGAKWTPFSQTVNLVVSITPAAGLTPHEHEAAVRLAGLRAAEYLGEAGRDMPADEVVVFEKDDIFEESQKYPGLPRVVYVEMLISQGLLHDSYIYGVNSQQILPTLMHPNEELDGAVVSGNCVAACDKITTYQHQNNSVICDLYDRHGKDINFLGVVMMPELTTLAGKYRTWDFTVKLCETLGADAVVVSEEGYGNPDSDLLMLCKRLENLGIKTVLITDECSGRDGLSQPLADTVPEAVAVVSAGNVSHMVHLPPAERVLGDAAAIATLAGGWDASLQPDGSLTCELNAVIGSTSEIGYHNLTIREY